MKILQDLVFSVKIHNHGLRYDGTVASVFFRGKITSRFVALFPFPWTDRIRIGILASCIFQPLKQLYTPSFTRIIEPRRVIPQLSNPCKIIIL